MSILDSYPAGALNLSLKDEEFQHALVGTEEALKGVASHVLRQRGHDRVVLNLKEFVLSMLNRHLKGIFTSDRLAHPLSNGLVFAFSNVIELHKYVHHELVLLLLGHGRPSLSLGLWEGIDLSLHPVDLQSAGNVRFDLRLINLTEDVQILPIVLLMRIEPVEGERAILV